MSAARRRWFQFSLRPIFVLLIVMALPLAYSGFLFNEMRQSINGFAAKHAEATPAIERIYAFYGQNGRWPDEADIKATGENWLPPGWEYYDLPPEQGGAMLDLHGPFHLSLYYRFEVPQQGVASRDWVQSFEGDKTEFQSDAPYSLGSKPEVETESQANERE